MKPFMMLFMSSILSVIALFWQQYERILLVIDRDFGFSDGSGRIQGRFTMKVQGPSDLQRVVFLIDGEQVWEDSEAPYTYQFETDMYSLGVHTISAVGYATSGSELKSNEFRREFVSADDGMAFAGKVLLPILGIIIGGMFISFALTWGFGHKKGVDLPPGAERAYGILGGAVCPKCNRPFSLHVYGLSLLLYRFDRCPFCGRWSLVRRTPLAILKIAEQAELAGRPAQIEPNGLTPEEVLRKDLDDSRFQDL